MSNVTSIGMINVGNQIAKKNVAPVLAMDKPSDKAEGTYQYIHVEHFIEYFTLFTFTYKVCDALMH